MPSYLIEHKVKTLAELWHPFEYRGFHFTQWAFNVAQGPSGDAWIAAKQIKASDANAALEKSRAELRVAIDRIAFVSQCFTVMDFEPLLIQRQDLHNDILFFRYSTEISPVPLYVADDEMASLDALESFHEKGDVFRLLREAGNASTYYTRLVMLGAALEAIAGEIPLATKKMTDKDFIKRHILKDETLFDAVFGYGTGIRNKLLHGAKVMVAGNEPNYVTEIYKRTLAFFNANCGTKINEGTVNPQRHFFGNYESLNLWLRFRGTKLVSLRQLVEEFAASRSGDGAFGQNYEIVDMPVGY